MDLPVFICPVCSSPLSRAGRSYSCAGKHSYDISKEGYVNLLLANQKQSREPGDSKEMLDARRSFLNKGYYKPLARSAASIIIRHKRRSQLAPFLKKLSYCQRRDFTSAPGYSGTLTGSAQNRLNARNIPVTGPVPADEAPGIISKIPDFIILDAGCGEGYYTDYISRNRAINDSSAIYGIDISKEGIKSASKRNSSINFAVAGIYNLPVLDNSVDAILNIFAPFNEDEFGRVLKDKGIIISVAPGARHLYEFKKNLYDDVYLNDEEFELSDKFYITETIRVKYELNIFNREDIANLLKMTPYYHKSSHERIEHFLENTNELKTTADFLIRIIIKNI